MMEIRGILRTRHSRADCIAASLRPDNLQSMRTWSEGIYVVTEVRGDSLRSVIASVDDYLMNLAIAEDLCSLVPEKGAGEMRGEKTRPRMPKAVLWGGNTSVTERTAPRREEQKEER